MANVKTNTELKRVNINLPSSLVERVKEYGDSLGINTTSAYIVLLNQALDQKQQINSMPAIIDLYNKVMANPQLLNSALQDDNDVNNI